VTTSHLSSLLKTYPSLIIILKKTIHKACFSVCGIDMITKYVKTFERSNTFDSSEKSSEKKGFSSMWACIVHPPYRKFLLAYFPFTFICLLDKISGFRIFLICLEVSSQFCVTRNGPFHHIPCIWSLIFIPGYEILFF